MIFILNRRELEITSSLKRQAEIREILSVNQIEYKLKTVDVSSQRFFQSRERGSVLLPIPTARYEYTFYVHKMDYDQAYYLIHKQN